MLKLIKFKESCLKDYQYQLVDVVIENVIAKNSLLIN